MQDYSTVNKMVGKHPKNTRETKRSADDKNWTILKREFKATL